MNLILPQGAQVDLAIVGAEMLPGDRQGHAIVKRNIVSLAPRYGCLFLAAALKRGPSVTP
jgi:hypothetical protein